MTGILVSEHCLLPTKEIGVKAVGRRLDLLHYAKS